MRRRVRLRRRRRGGGCRGGAALARALAEKWIAAAGLDVFEEEPKIHPALLPLANVVIAPHIASASFDTRVAMSMLAVKNCVAVLESKAPLTPVL